MSMPPTSGPPSSYYLSPPDSQPEPAYTGNGFAAAAAPQAPAFAQPEAPAWQDPSAPPARPNPNPLIAFAMGTGTMSGQFSGPALWSIGIGGVGLAVWFFTPLYFKFLPIAGIIAGVRAVLSGRLIGGLVGIGLNVVAGFFSLVAMGVILR